MSPGYLFIICLKTKILKFVHKEMYAYEYKT